MSHGIYSALSGAIAQSVSLETTATNLANASTPGYRAIRPAFQQVLARASGSGFQARFVAVRTTGIDTSKGAVELTERPLDILLPADAFLAVQTANGERYTRAGALEISAEGLLTLRRGEPVLDENAEVIEVGPDAEVELTRSGEVKANGNGVGFLRVVTFADPRQMTYEGSRLLMANAEAGEPAPSTQPLEIGKLEGSNATPVKAMSELMMATRMFEAMQRAIETFRAIDQRLVTTVPK